jgi:hypothetical protein
MFYNVPRVCVGRIINDNLIEMSKEELREKYEKETGKSHGNALFSTTDYACWLEKKIEALRIHDVVGRSEQLKCDNCKCTPTFIHNTPSGRFCEACRPVTL